MKDRYHVSLISVCLKLAVGCRTQGAEGRDRSETEPWWTLLSAARPVGGVCLYLTVCVRPAVKVQRGHWFHAEFDRSRPIVCVTWNSQALHTSVVHLRLLIIDNKLLAQDVNLIKLIQKVYFNCHEINIHYIAKSIGSPPSNERFDYFNNFHEYKS